MEAVVLDGVRSGMLPRCCPLVTERCAWLDFIQAMTGTRSGTVAATRILTDSEPAPDRCPHVGSHRAGHYAASRGPRTSSNTLGGSPENWGALHFS